MKSYLPTIKSLCLCLSVTTSLSILPVRSFAQHDHHHHTHHDHSLHLGNAAPIGVMGDHMHSKGDFMVSYRYMRMDMDGNRDGTSSLNPVDIATTYANRFASTAGQPPTLRVVPTEMTMDMHMVGAMYAPSDRMTFMVMGQYLEKEMDHITFAGGAGTTERGRFTTKNSGWGDTKVGGLFRLYNDSVHHVHLNIGVSLPTGSLEETATVLAPTGATPRLRMPYAMQLGTGTYDLHPGVTYTGQNGPWSWGAQYSAEWRLEDENDEGYAWGDKHRVTVWSGYQWTPVMSTSARLTGTTQDAIDGIDANIVAPVQTADPDNYGGDTVELGLGVRFTGQTGPLLGHALAFEVQAPLYRDLNGPQMETDVTATAGWQYAF